MKQDSLFGPPKEIFEGTEDQDVRKKKKKRNTDDSDEDDMALLGFEDDGIDHDALN